MLHLFHRLIKSSGLTEITFGISLIAISAGCTTNELIHPDQATIGPDSSVIAFSVNTTTLSKHDAWIRPSGIQIRYGDEFVAIDLSQRQTGVRRVLLEVPATTVMFSEFEVESGTGIYWSRYQTGYSQPLALTHGEITYLGRIEIEDAKFAEDAGGSRAHPYAVKLVFSDALQDDLNVWQQEYEIFQNRLPVGKLVAKWTGQDYLDLWRKRFSNSFYESYLERALDGNEGDPIRGPMPTQAPP